MADSEADLPEDAAEKAYAAASEAIVVTPKAAEVPVEPAPVAAAPETAPAPEPVEFKPKRAAPKPKAAKPAAPTELKAPPAAKPKAGKTPKISTKPAAPKRKAIIKPKITTKSSKEPVMATKKTAAKPADIKQFVADAKVKAQAAYAKGGAVLSEAGEFTKGNFEALVQSGKILSTGVQSLGKTYVAEAKTAIETTKADVKALAAVNTPSAFFKLHSDILRRNFDDALALSSKNTKAVFKLANDRFAPISGRVTLAVSKVKKAA